MLLGSQLSTPNLHVIVPSLRAVRASGPAASPRPGRPNSFLDWARGALPVPAWPTIAGNGGKVKVEGSVIACPFTK